MGLNALHFYVCAYVCDEWNLGEVGWGGWYKG
jgi:hypothetical protein